MKRLPVGVVVGTRPEAVKLAPVIQGLQRSNRLRPLLIATSQHGPITRQIFRNFGVSVDYDLRVMQPGQTLSGLSSRLLTRLDRFFQEAHPRAVLVQGDTTSAFMGALSAFYHGIPVGHVEAGLRTGNVLAPFPEEMNRKLVSSLATWHFAPTREAVRRLRRESVPASVIFQTGNPVVDALRWMAPRCRRDFLHKLIGRSNLRRPLLLVTCHRRESLGRPMRSVALGLARIARSHPEVIMLFPVHPNPAVGRVMLPVLQRIPNVLLSEPLDYLRFLTCLQHAHLVLSDSGGIQEEAVALGKPLLVLRHETERPEGLRTGALKLIGTDAGRIAQECDRLLKHPRAHARMCRASNIFGDRQAARRIVAIMERVLR